jgi:serine/threonine protein kinase
MSHALIGKQFGNYVLDALLGEGGMGAVFRGTHRFLGQPVAVKVLHGTFAKNPNITERFFQEAKSSIEIAHPNVIKIIDFGQTPEGELYLVMEYLEGESLSGAIKTRGRFSEADAAAVAAEVCDGLYAAHLKGIVHRDLKPDNLFITSSGEVRILDFGIAKIMSSGAGTKTGSMMGTPQYMAPEQARDSKQVGPYTDIYAMGAILFAMVTGQPPFSGTELAELIAHHLFDEPPRPSELAPISAELESLILRCLAKKPDARPSDMAAVRDELRARIGLPALGQRLAAAPLSARMPAIAPSVPPTSGSASGSRPPLSQPPLSQPPVSRSSPGGTTLSASASESIAAAPKKSGGLLVAAAAVVAVGGVVAFVVTRPHDAPSPAVQPAAVIEKAPPEKVAPPEKIAEKPVAKAVEEKVIVRSEPPGAQVSVDGKEAGTTPALLTLTLPHEVALSLDGYQPAHEILSAAGETVVHLVKKASEHHSSAHATKKPDKPAAKPASKPADEPRGEGLY